VPRSPRQLTLLADAESLLQRGEGGKVREGLLKLASQTVPRRHRLALAALCRRVYLPQLALHFLHPLIRGGEDSNGEERAEYAFNLLRIGREGEAREILDSLDPHDVPASLLYRALCHIAGWDHAAALPPLFDYCARPGLSIVDRLFGETSLAGALHYAGRGDEAEPILARLREETSRPGLALLHASVMDLSVRVALAEEDWRTAEQLIQAVEARSRQLPISDLLFGAKWSCLLRLHRFGLRERGLEEIDRLRAEADRLGQPEVRRELDRALAVATGDPEIYLRVHFGTPFAHYRERLRREMAEPPRLPELHRLRLGPDTASAPTLDLSDGRLHGKGLPSAGTPVLKRGQTPHRLLWCLASDGYRPFRIARLHALCLPDEYWTPRESPGRTERALDKLRALLEETGLPLAVAEARGGVSLVATGPLVLATFSLDGVPERQRLLDRAQSVRRARKTSAVIGPIVSSR
jgi:hypothetical protein